VLVEGGARVHGAFYQQRLVDELLLLYAPFIVGDNGTPLVQGYKLESREQAPALLQVSLRRLGRDTLLKAYLNDLSQHFQAAL
jgi:diaminohydroxyphosphoribosylaminopyrimidine deaminase/5-amino-6-(5-phosphoribosylamino)uracil reductase